MTQRMPLKRPLKIKTAHGKLLIEDLPTDKREFELRCGRGLARHLAKELCIEVGVVAIGDDQHRGDVRLHGPQIDIEGSRSRSGQDAPVRANGGPRRGDSLHVGHC